MRKESIPLIGNQPVLLSARALFGVVSMTCFFTTLQRIPMGAAVSLKYLSPIFAAIFAAFFLKERVRPVQWLFFGLAFVGVMLLKGFDVRIDMLSLSLGILGAVTGGLVYVTIRRIGEHDHPLVIVNYFMIAAAVLSGFAMIPVWTTPVGTQWLWLLAIGTLGFLGQYFMTKAFQIEKTSRIAPLKYTEILYSLIIGLLWFGESYTFLSLIGIILVLALIVPSILYK